MKKIIWSDEPFDDTKPQHTPTPWEMKLEKADKSYRIFDCIGGSVMAYSADEENAAYIVKAVNCHEDYKEVTMYARAVLKALEPRFMRTGCSDTEQVAIKCLREAIAKAEARS